MNRNRFRAPEGKRKDHKGDRRVNRRDASTPPRVREGHERRPDPEKGGQGDYVPRPLPGGEFVMGRNCVQELIKRSPDRLLEVFLADASAGHEADRKSGRNQDTPIVGDLPVPARVIVRRVSRRELDALVSSDSHQGVVARVKPRRFATLDELVNSARTATSARIVALDGVQDPHNFGAILRAAECFGATAVVWSKNRTAPLTPVVTKVSVGASELLTLCPVANLHQALERLKAEGVWVVGAMIASDAQPLDTFEVPERCMVVVGAEGEGIHKIIEKSLDYKVYIPMSGQIDSLNVSQATAVILSHVASQHRQKGLVKVA